MDSLDESPVFSPVGSAPQSVAASHPTCNHALVADLFAEDAPQASEQE